MNKVYIAIDVGCHECSVDSEAIGAFYSKEEAEEAADRRSEATSNLLK